MSDDRDTLALGVRSHRVDDPPPPPVPVPPDDAARRAQFEIDAAKAQYAKLAKELEDTKKQLLTDEERAQFESLKAAADADNEKKKREEGKFDEWRHKIEEENARQLALERENTAEAKRLAAAGERELNETLIGRAFADAVEWFGVGARTVLLPDMAQKVFGDHVEIEVVPGLNGASPRRRVIVKDLRGQVILDTKTGQPAEFSKAIGELIETNPRRQHLLRASGKVGSGSTGEGGGPEGKDLNRLKSEDFKDPKVREAIRERHAKAGGMVIGSAWNRDKT